MQVLKYILLVGSILMLAINIYDTLTGLHPSYFSIFANVVVIIAMVVSIRYTNKQKKNTPLS